MAPIAQAGFNAAALGFPTGVADMQARGLGFWGRGSGLEEGDRVHIQKAQAEAQERYLTVLQADPRASPVLPVVDLVDPEWVRKAIFTPGNAGIEELKNNITKALYDLQDAAESIQKATTTSSSLMHSISDTDVAMLFKKIMPAQVLIPVEVNKGKIAQWDAIPPNGAGSAFFGSEDPVLVESDIQDHTRTETCKILYAVMRVTKMAVEAGRTQIPARDMLAIRSMAATEMLKNLRERAILGVTRDVRVTKTQYAPAGPLEYPGLHELITNNTADPNYVDVSGEVEAVNTMDKVQPFLDNTYLEMIQDGIVPNLAMCDYKTFGMYRRGLNDFFRSENVETVDYGVAKINLTFPGGTVPMVPIPFLPSTAGTNGMIFLMDTNFLARRTLWAETYEELANENTSKRAVITAAECIIDKTDVDGESSLQGGVFGITIA
jgi:hypothetical protein